MKITTFETKDEQPYTDLKITEHYQEDYSVKETIKNTSPKVVSNLVVYAIFYDSNGNILTIGQDEPLNFSWYNLYSREEKSFEIYHFESISSYDFEIDYELE